MNIENTQAQMRKGILEYCILLIIAQQDAYVPDIISKLKASKMIRGRRDDIPFINPVEKYRIIVIPLGRVTARPSPQILQHHGTRARFSQGTRKLLE